MFCNLPLSNFLFSNCKEKENEEIINMNFQIRYLDYKNIIYNKHDTLYYCDNNNR